MHERPALHRLLGLVFVVAVLVAVALSVLAYRKVFTPVVRVTLVADHTGLQLQEGADVKLHGVIVGEVRQISSDGQQARLRLALDPATAGHVPASVQARLLPRTLFGEKYVELVIPASETLLPPIADGAVIAQDSSAAAVELERIIDETLPLLQAIRPDALAATLGTLSNALDGRGSQLGADITTAERVLTELNGQMSAIATDVKRLVDVANTYDGVADDLLAILRNLTVTMDTIVDQRAQLSGFLADTTDLANSARGFLERNGDRIIRLGEVARPVLELLAAYSPEYPCLLQGAVALQPRAEQAFTTGSFHITLEITKDQGKYVPGRDAPVYGAEDGPNCRGLPSPSVPYPATTLDDGYGYGGASMGIAGTSEESNVVKPIVAAASGVRIDQVPDAAVLLWGPLLRGTVVNLG
jgi:phospholipid/cholesterol/gamma-HCH transport system substrate-binding protein